MSKMRLEISGVGLQDHDFVHVEAVAYVQSRWRRRKHEPMSAANPRRVATRQGFELQVHLSHYNLCETLQYQGVSMSYKLVGILQARAGNEHGRELQITTPMAQRIALSGRSIHSYGK